MVALHRWTRRKLAEPEPLFPLLPAPLVVASLRALRMAVSGVGWLREQWSHIWLYAWERRHAR
jgi:hypothetical protein